MLQVGWQDFKGKRREVISKPHKNYVICCLQETTCTSYKEKKNCQKMGEITVLFVKLPSFPEFWFFVLIV